MSYTSLTIRNQPPSVTGRLTMKFTWMYTFHPESFHGSLCLHVDPILFAKGYGRDVENLTLLIG